MLALGDAQVRALLAIQSVEASPTQEMKAFLAHERDKFGKVVRDLGIAMEQ